MNNYILPSMKYSVTFEKMNASPIFSTDVIYIEDLEQILSFHRTCIVAEPGYGKTRLLSEIFESCIKQGKKCALIDLKKIDRRLEEFLQSEDILKQKNRFEIDGLSKSGNFKLDNTEDVVICLDALDEVKNSRFGRDMQEKLRDVFVKLDKKIIILLQKVNDLFKFRFSY